MRSEYDVIIVGAGLVGLVLACLLVKNGLHVAIVEAGRVEKNTLENDTYQLRVSAINLAAKHMFADLGVWQHIITSRLSAFEKMFVWDSLGKGKINFDCTEIAEPCLGYILENALIFNALLSEMESNNNLTIFAESIPHAISLTQKSIQLQFKKRQQDSQEIKTIQAKLLVGADGADSWVRQHANIESYEWSYDHRALVTTVETEYPHQKTAWQCFLPEGPLALLPLYPSHICSIVWSGPPDEIKRLEGLSPESFNFEISNAFEYRLGKIKKIADHASFPLKMTHAKHYINNRIALIGDAAHTLHPLAGQGINLGFADAQALAEIIIEAKKSDKDFANYTLLRKYERKRKSDNWIMIFGMEFFKRLFQSESFMTIFTRSIGLKLVNKLGFIKDQFIYKAIGK